MYGALQTDRQGLTVYWGVSLCPFVLALAFAASPSRAAEGLECLSLKLSISEIVLPALDVHVAAEVHNSSSSPILLVKPNLSFSVEDAKGHSLDVSRQVYVEPEASNSWFVQPGQTATLKFLVQLLHDAPVGRLRVQPRIEWVNQADNVAPLLALGDGKGTATAQQWSLDNPAASFNANASVVTSPEPALAGVHPIAFTVSANRTKGRITLDSPTGSIRPTPTTWRACSTSPTAPAGAATWIKASR